MNTRRIVFMFSLCCLAGLAPVQAAGLPEEAWRALPERSLDGATVPLRINLLAADVPAQWLDNPATKVMSPIARTLADQQDRDEHELKDRAAKRIEVIVGSDRLQFKIRKNGLIMRAKFD